MPFILFVFFFLISCSSSKVRALYKMKLLANSSAVIRFSKITQKLFSSAGGITSTPLPPAPSKTPLYDLHIRHGGRMFDFAGYLLPVQYGTTSITASHLHCRRYGSIFDVSHMMQSRVYGRDAVAVIESLCTADIAGLQMGAGTLTVFTDSTTGGILDDFIVCRDQPLDGSAGADDLFIVSNASMRVQDQQLMRQAVKTAREQRGQDVNIKFVDPDERALIAVQGPHAVATLLRLCDDQNRNAVKQQRFMRTLRSVQIAGVEGCRVTRCGYTGEDGVEISIPAKHAETVTEALLDVDGSSMENRLKLAGLGARDSLRLEAGLCLHGSDIDTSATPIEAGLAWLVGTFSGQEPFTLINLNVI